MMPRMNGLDAARTIREMKRREARRVPIIAMSANAFAEDIINSGQLLSDEFVIRLIQDSIAHSENVEGFLFDGFPRTVAQAEKLDEILKENGAPLAGLLNIEVPETELKRRMLERAQIEGRADDTEEAIHNRFKEYHAKTVPVAKHYQTICHTVKGDGTMEEVFEEISKIIEKIK